MNLPLEQQLPYHPIRHTHTLENVPPLKQIVLQSLNSQPMSSVAQTLKSRTHLSVRIDTSLDRYLRPPPQDFEQSDHAIQVTQLHPQ